MIDPASYNQGFFDGIIEVPYHPHPDLPDYATGYRDGQVDLFAVEFRIELGRWPSQGEEEVYRLVIEGVIYKRNCSPNLGA